MELQIRSVVFDTAPRYSWQRLLSLLAEQTGEINPPETVKDWRYKLGITPDQPRRWGKYSRRDLAYLKGWVLWRRKPEDRTFGAYIDWLLAIVERVENEEDLSENITEIEVKAYECECE